MDVDPPKVRAQKVTRNGVVKITFSNVMMSPNDEDENTLPLRRLQEKLDMFDTLKFQEMVRVEVLN